MSQYQTCHMTPTNTGPAPIRWVIWRLLSDFLRCTSECAKIAHRRSLAFFTADEGIAGDSATRIIFTRFHRRRNRGSLAIFFAEEIAHLGASKSRAIFPQAVKNRRRHRRESRDFQNWCTQMRIALHKLLVLVPSKALKSHESHRGLQKHLASQTCTRNLANLPQGTTASETFTLLILSNCRSVSVSVSLPSLIQRNYISLIYWGRIPEGG